MIGCKRLVSLALAGVLGTALGGCSFDLAMESGSLHYDLEPDLSGRATLSLFGVHSSREAKNGGKAAGYTKPYCERAVPLFEMLSESRSFVGPYGLLEDVTMKVENRTDQSCDIVMEGRFQRLSDVPILKVTPQGQRVSVKVDPKERKRRLGRARSKKHGEAERTAQCPPDEDVLHLSFRFPGTILQQNADVYDAAGHRAEWDLTRPRPLAEGQDPEEACNIVFVVETAPAEAAVPQGP
jgi:hypothetical protein